MKINNLQLLKNLSRDYGINRFIFNDKDVEEPSFNNLIYCMDCNDIVKLNHTCENYDIFKPIKRIFINIINSIENLDFITEKNFNDTIEKYVFIKFNSIDTNFIKIDLLSLYVNKDDFYNNVDIKVRLKKIDEITFYQDKIVSNTNKKYKLSYKNSALLNILKTNNFLYKNHYHLIFQFLENEKIDYIDFDKVNQIFSKLKELTDKNNLDNWYNIYKDLLEEVDDNESLYIDFIYSYYLYEENIPNVNLIKNKYGIKDLDLKIILNAIKITNYKFFGYLYKEKYVFYKKYFNKGIDLFLKLKEEGLYYKTLDITNLNSDYDILFNSENILTEAYHYYFSNLEDAYNESDTVNNIIYYLNKYIYYTNKGIQIPTSIIRNIHLKDYNKNKFMQDNLSNLILLSNLKNEEDQGIIIELFYNDPLLAYNYIYIKNNDLDENNYIVKVFNRKLESFYYNKKDNSGKINLSHLRKIMSYEEYQIINYALKTIKDNFLAVEKLNFYNFDDSDNEVFSQNMIIDIIGKTLTNDEFIILMVTILYFKDKLNKEFKGTLETKYIFNETDILNLIRIYNNNFKNYSFYNYLKEVYLLLVLSEVDIDIYGVATISDNIDNLYNNLLYKSINILDYYFSALKYLGIDKLNTEKFLARNILNIDLLNLGIKRIRLLEANHDYKSYSKELYNKLIDNKMISENSSIYIPKTYNEFIELVIKSNLPLNEVINALNLQSYYFNKENTEDIEKLYNLNPIIFIEDNNKKIIFLKTYYGLIKKRFI